MFLVLGSRQPDWDEGGRFGSQGPPTAQAAIGCDGNLCMREKSVDLMSGSLITILDVKQCRLQHDKTSSKSINLPKKASCAGTTFCREMWCSGTWRANRAHHLHLVTSQSSRMIPFSESVQDTGIRERLSNSQRGYHE